MKLPNILMYDNFFAKPNRVNYHSGEVFSLKIKCQTPQKKSTNLFLYVKTVKNLIWKKEGKNISDLFGELVF